MGVQRIATRASLAMPRFQNTDGTWLALAAIAGVTALKSRSGSPNYEWVVWHDDVDALCDYRPGDVSRKTTVRSADDLSMTGMWIYVPSEEELEAVRWVGDRYATTKYLLDNLIELPLYSITGKTVPAFQIDNWKFSYAVWADGFSHRVAMLSDDLPLQRLTFRTSNPEDDAYPIIDLLLDAGMDEDWAYAIGDVFARDEIRSDTLSDIGEQLPALMKDYSHLRELPAREAAKVGLSKTLSGTYTFHQSRLLE